MQNFVYYNRTRTIFGKETEKLAGEEVKKYSRRILLHHSGGHVVRNGTLGRVQESLSQAGVSWAELGGVKPNPVLSKVYEGIELCRKEKLDFILAVGGGSVIDSAKAIALGTLYDGDVWDFYENRKTPSGALSVAAVLTIPAAGSESSIGSVITNEEGPWKQSVDSESIRPVFSILNPELTYTLPAYQTACGVADILAHIMERYFTREKHVELTDELCEGAMRTVIRNGRRILSGGERDYDARAEVMWAGSIAHNNLLDTGRIGDWASHQIEHQLSAFYDIAHGAGLAIIFPAWMRYTLDTDDSPETALLFAKFAERVWGVSGACYDPKQSAREGIFRYKSYLKSIGLPVCFSDAGLNPDKIPQMVQEAVKFGAVGHYRPLNERDVEAIYRIAASDA
ncbi:MAG: iron-containing alcohol dehydrogenase [Christensenella sp.]